ncbi:CD151 antigen-like [Saccostrea echinata]|uniref:CD151 antigen-like n=1 Tax=Saccostrea echinata TaxID=191078 RepID=UPI002A808625|nr:CD151 antigen-like [Saccostrea echinata]
MGCCCSFYRMKKIFIIFNTVLWFAGPALLGVSIWQYITLQSYDPILEIGKFQISAIIYISAGVASTFNGIIGCIGGVNERKGVILLFLFFLVMISGAEVLATVQFFKFYDEMPQYLSGRLLKFVQDYYLDSSVRENLDNLQKEMECCGCYNYTDWSATHIPSTCFKMLVDQHNLSNTSNMIYTDGCSEALEAWAKDNLLIIGWGGFSFSIAQIFGAIISSCFYYTLKKEFG